MTCQRCSGYMILETHYIPDETEMSVYGWRCLNCGEMIDPTIMHNRRTVSTGPLRIFCRRGSVGSPVPVRLSPTPANRTRRSDKRLVGPTRLRTDRSST